MRNSAAGIANSTYHLYAARTAASSAATIYAYAGVAGTDPDSAAAITTMLTALQAESGGTSYVYARRIGSIIRESAAIVLFFQSNDYFQRKSKSVDANVTVDGTGSFVVSAKVPMGLKVKYDFASYVSFGSAATFLYLDLDVTNETPSGTVLDQAIAAGGNDAARFIVITDRSGQFKVRSSVAGPAVVISQRGWWDSRGKDN